MKKNRIGKMVFVWAALLTLSGCAKEPAVLWDAPVAQSEETEAPGKEDGQALSERAADASDDVIVVDICGAVKKPGVYKLEQGARVFDVVKLAGGLLADADADSLNQAAFLQDADKIRVYTKAEAKGAEPADGAAGGGKVDINRADIAQLCTLSGIGQSRAQDIIAYREANGKFSTIEDIMKVSGIKTAVFQKIKDSITVQ